MRIRWLNSKEFSKDDLNRAASGISGEPFEESGNSGFLIERKRATFLDANYVERFDWTETISDPFGASQEVNRREYRETSFRLSTQGPNIEIYDPPRSISPLLNRLETFLGLDFVVLVPEVDVLVWLKAMQEEIETPMVTSVVLSRLSLSVKAFAQVSIRGTEDVRTYISDMVGERPFKIDRLAVSGVQEGQNIRLMLRSDARATIISGSERLLPVLRTGLTKALSGC